MNLNCLKNSIITDGLAIQIDLTDINSWNLNTGFTSISLSEWTNAVSDNLDLYDFGLTAYDNGRIDHMYSGEILTPNDTKVTLYRVGYNTGNTAYDSQTVYTDLNINSVTTGNTGNYFMLDGGYLQGFFKLQNYNYELFPARYAAGITIENIVLITPESFDGGIFYLMGSRAEDKYNLYYSGETKKIIKTFITNATTGIIGQQQAIITTTTGWSGVTTSEGDHLISYQPEEISKIAFGDWATRNKEVWTNTPQIDNIKDNIMAFFLNPNGKIGLKYINGSGSVITKTSSSSVTTGWTIITHTFTPDVVIEDINKLKCEPRRKGTFKMYVNGKLFWTLNDFDEYYFRDFSNDREKVEGVPYTISWGGGSFGLKHSWHYDKRTLPIYTGESQTYIEDNFSITNDPLITDPCFTGATGGSYNSYGVVLSADNTTFYSTDDCNPSIIIPETVMSVKHTGATDTTRTQYYIEFAQPIEVLSNRDIVISAKIYNTGIFQELDANQFPVVSSISLIPIGTEDIEIQQEQIYKQPITSADYAQPTPFPIVPQEYEYIDGETALSISGPTGFPVISQENLEILAGHPEYKQAVYTGDNKWINLYAKFNMKKNTGQQFIKVGLLIESTLPLVDNFMLYVDDFIYTAPDNLSQDSTKDNLLIEQNFNSSFIGGIQKLRIYDTSLSAQQVLHNAKIELKNTPEYGYIITKGGRIIYS